VRHGQAGKGDCGDQGGNAAEQRADGACGRGQSQRVTRARYAAIGDWRAQGVMASAGGVFCSCYLMAMLPLRRRSRLVGIGPRTLAVSRWDRSLAMDFAADMIQPNCRHYATGATKEHHLLAPQRGVQPQLEPSQCRNRADAQREWHVQLLCQVHMFFLLDSNAVRLFQHHSIVIEGHCWRAIPETRPSHSSRHAS
jgi:hypothetical protein